MRILLSGSSGFVGSALKTHLSAADHEVTCLMRNHTKQPTQDAIFWDPEQGNLRKEDFEGFDAVIHLAGANIGAHRWSKKVKDQIFLSRCRDTWLLSQILCRLYRPPKTLISASAVGIYGNRGDEILTENSSLGSGFLSDLCTKWERATDSIENRGTRVIHTRFGHVLDPRGGILGKLIPLFRLGLGGKWGSGKQFVSWIALQDLVRAIEHCLNSESLSGPVNCVAPHPAAQAEFARIIAKKLHRPALGHLPAWLLKLVLGEMAKETLLSSQRAMPEKLLEMGYLFKYPNLSSLQFSF